MPTSDFTGWFTFQSLSNGIFLVDDSHPINPNIPSNVWILNPDGQSDHSTLFNARTCLSLAPVSTTTYKDVPEIVTADREHDPFRWWFAPSANHQYCLINYEQENLYLQMVEQGPKVTVARPQWTLDNTIADPSLFWAFERVEGSIMSDEEAVESREESG